jgi:hypothetical protein
VSARLDWSDAAAVSSWLACLWQSFDDADGVTLDLLRPPRERELGPVLQAKNYGQARAQILAALAYAGASEADGDEEDGAA